MRAPNARVASTLARGASSGMTMVARVPTCFEAMAVACAWLPEENATTPRSSSSGDRDRIRFDAPRILKAPPRCRFSHFRNTRRPARSSTLRDVMVGVRCASGLIRSAASRTRAGEKISGKLTRRLELQPMLAVIAEPVLILLIERSEAHPVVPADKQHQEG